MRANSIEECPKCKKTGARRNLATDLVTCPYCGYDEDPGTVTHTCAIDGCETTTTMRKDRLAEGQWVCPAHSTIDIGEESQPKPGQRGHAWRPVTYVHFYTMLVPVAKEHGYALALHGTVQRDLDMIAVPWVEEPSSHYQLLEAFCDALGIRKLFRIPDHHRGEKLHGRVAYNIPVMDGGWMDISIMPVTERTK